MEEELSREIADLRADLRREALEDVQHGRQRRHREVEHEVLDAGGDVGLEVLHDLCR